MHGTSREGKTKAAHARARLGLPFRPLAADVRLTMLSEVVNLTVRERSLNVGTFAFILSMERGGSEYWYHPDALHSFRNDGVTRGKARQFQRTIPRKHDDQDVIHYVQHGSSDLEYPHGHLQGFGFVPKSHEVASHVQLEDSVRPVTDVVPTKGSAAGGNAYH